MSNQISFNSFCVLHETKSGKKKYLVSLDGRALAATLDPKAKGDLIQRTMVRALHHCETQAVPAGKTTYVALEMKADESVSYRADGKSAILGADQKDEEIKNAKSWQVVSLPFCDRTKNLVVKRKGICQIY